MEIPKEWVTEDGGLYYQGDNYIVWPTYECNWRKIILDGEFTPEELEVIIAYVRRKLNDGTVPVEDSEDS